MHGNVSEWCHDYYERDYYQNSPDTDPQGPTRGNERVLRGGAFYSQLGMFDLAEHKGFSPETRSALFVSWISCVAIRYLCFSESPHINVPTFVIHLPLG